MELVNLITLYISAWSEPNHLLREQLLESIWAEDGTYTDPSVHIPNRKEFINHINKFVEQFPGCRFDLTSEIDTHHKKFRFTWRMILADGKVAMEGIDFGELSPEGKLHCIVGFFGLPTPKS